MNLLKTVLLITLVALVTLFVLQNTETVTIQFLLWTYSLPQALLVILLLIVGFLLGALVTSFSGLKNEIKQNKIK